MSASSTQATWEAFCGADTKTSFSWNSGVPDLCWSQVVFVLPTHVLLLTVATALLVCNKHQLVRYVPWQIQARQATCVLLCLVQLGSFVASWVVLHSHPPAAWIGYSAQFSSFMVLSWALICNKEGHALSSTGRSIVLHCSWFLACCTSILSTYAVQHLPHDYPLFPSAYGFPYTVSVYATLGLHCCYFFTLLVSFFRTPARYAPSRKARQLQQIGIEASETQPLIVGSSASAYGTVASGEATEGGSRFALSAEDGASYASRLMFCWLGKLLAAGWKGELKSPDDLDVLPRDLRTQSVRARFDRHVCVSIEKAFAVDDQPPCSVNTDSTKEFSLLRALNRAFGWEYYPLGLLRFACDLLGFAGPLLLHALVTFIEDRTEPLVHGYYYAAGLFVSTLIVALLQSQFNFCVNKVMVGLRAALVTAVYRKTLAVDTVALGVFSTGEIVNLMSTDTDRVVNFANSFHSFWSLPFQVAIALYLLHQQVGLAFLAGLGFSLVMIPVNRFLANKIGELSQTMMEKKDGRVKIMAEILRGIRVIKFYAWEKVFGGKINKLREEELSSLKGRKYLDALCVYLWATTPVIISLLTFGTYVALGHKLTAAKVFTSVALFNMLITPLNAFPWVLNGLMESWVSMKRLRAFFTLPQISWCSYYRWPVDSDSYSEVLHMDRCTFSWAPPSAAVHAKQMYSSGSSDGGGNKDHADTGAKATASSELLLLRELNLTIRRGSLVGVAGSVGSGKSSLLAAITAEMGHMNGMIYYGHLVDGFGLVSQESWLQHATVRENILFGRPLNVARYQEVIHACALQEDLSVLPAGDETEVGENGVTLSGGQKARISLARAVYQDKDVYLLDDPLAAVDVHVAQHLFQHCIMGMLLNKTRILCTHHTQFLVNADLVLLMENGRISQQGLPADVLPPELLSRRQGGKRQATESGQGTENEEDKNNLEGEKDGAQPQDVLVQEEERSKGVVASSVYLSYWKAVGNFLAPAVLLSLLLMQASRNTSDWWLSYWISHTRSSSGNSSSMANSSYFSPLSPQSCSYDGWQQFALLPMPDCYVHGSDDSLSDNSSSNSSDLSFYLTVYGSLGAANTVFTLLRAFLFAYGGVCAARVLHNRLLASILSAPVSFFDATPIGRILNRFSSDCYAIDDTLPFQLNILLAMLFGLLGTIAITCYGLPWFALLLLPLGLIYYFIQRYYRKTSRELKRLSTVTLSPVYSHFSETLAGLATVRAMRAVFRFADENERRLDISQRANYAGYATAVWLSLRLQLLGVMMVAGVSLIAVLQHHFGSVDAGLVGLAVSYALTVTGRLSGVVQMFTETEKEMISTERAVQYIEGIEPEKQVTQSGVGVSSDWPTGGEVAVDNVRLTYRPGLPPALDGVSFACRAGEKIGIVGRTGSGKSSLLQALFRMVNFEAGTVSIDGVDIQSVPLARLRSSIAIIPQDPFLFGGSVRHNLDPGNMSSDHRLFAALNQCHLADAVARLGGLDGEVGESGRHFSVGQRQLVCLARALLTGCKVLCIDEATASVDQATDARIQVTLRNSFPSTTVLTVAHRIDTILQSDRVLVMDAGRVAEFAPPSELRANSDSLFSRLVRESHA